MNEPLTDEEYRQLLELGGANEVEAAQMAKQLEMAKQLRMATAPQTRSANGLIYAPGRAESIVGALGAGLSGYQQAKGMGRQETIAKNKQQQMALMLKGILGRGSGQQMPGMEGPSTYGMSSNTQMGPKMPVVFPDYPEY